MEILNLETKRLDLLVFDLKIFALKFAFWLGDLCVRKN